MAILGNPTKYQDFPQFEAIGDGTNTLFELPWIAGSVNSVDVFVGGSIQHDTFIIAGKNILFNSPPASGERVLVKSKGIRSVNLPKVKQERKIINPTVGQTTFSTSPYTYQLSTNNVAVYVNGTRWILGQDFEEIDTQTIGIIGSHPFIPSDTVELVIGYDVDGGTWAMNSSSVLTRQRFSSNGTDTSFTLASTPGLTGAAVVIYINGVYQQTDAYSINGAVVTFAEPPPVGTDNIEMIQYTVTDIGETDASLVAYLPAGAGAVPTNVQTKLRESVSVKDFGAVGDGVTDDTAAMQLALNAAEGKTLVLPSGNYRIVGTTLVVKHPTNIVGAGAERTVFVFEGMGGLAGLDGIYVDVPESAPFGASSHFSDFTVVAKGSHGRHGISTRRSLTLSGTTNVWSLNRPQYVFERINIRGGVNLGGGSLARYDYGWARYFDLGDSRESIFRQCYVAGFYDTFADTSLAGTIDALSTVAFYWGGAEDANGGAVFMPQLDHCFAYFVGEAMNFGRRVSNGRILNAQFHRVGFGIRYTTEWLGTSYPGLSEMQIAHLNINSTFAGIAIKHTDFISINDVRSTRSSDTFNHASTWYGFRIEEARQATLTNIRGYYSQPDTLYTNARAVARLEKIGVLHISDVFCRHDLAGAFNYIVDLVDCNQATVSGIGNTGNVTTAVRIGGVSVTQPFVSVKNLNLSADVTNRVLIDGVVTTRNLDIERRAGYRGIADTVTLSTAGTTTLSPSTETQVYRFAFAAGTGAYIRDLQMAAQGQAGDICKIWIQFNSTAGTNPTVNIKDQGGTTRLTLVGTSVLKKYMIEMVNIGTGSWILLNAVQQEI